MSKYLFSNILKTKKLYIPFFFIITLILFMLMCSFSIRENIMTAGERHIGKYAAVAIITKDGYFSTPSRALERIYIDEDLIKNYMIPEYISDYYAFNQQPSGSNTLKPILSNFMTTIYDESMPFPFMIYSDISKSTHFRIGDRRITEGRFAKNTSECNISSELAELNELSVGDYIELFLSRNNPQYYNFKIVGIYEDKTDEISNELVLVQPKATLIDEQITVQGIYKVYDLSQISIDNVSRNQILTTASSSIDLTAFSFMGMDLGYDVLVYYAHDEMSMFSYIEKTSELLPEQFEIFDSGDMLRSILLILKKTENSFKWFLVFAVILGVIFGILIIIYVLKDRTYDIGVFRTRGISRVKTAFLFSSEIFIVSLSAFVAAWILYITIFTQIFGFAFRLQGNITINNDYNYFNIMNEVRNHEIFLSVSPFEFFISLFVVVVFTVIVGLAAVLFISRHEPMKTMTEI